MPRIVLSTTRIGTPSSIKLQIVIKGAMILFLHEGGWNITPDMEIVLFYIVLYALAFMNHKSKIFFF